MTIQGVYLGLSAITRQREAMDRAAEKVARATIASTSAEPGKDSLAGTLATPLLDGTLELMVSKRMFTAAIKMAQTANEGVIEALRIGGYSPAPQSSAQP